MFSFIDYPTKRSRQTPDGMHNRAPLAAVAQEILPVAVVQTTLRVHNREECERADDFERHGRLWKVRQW